MIALAAGLALADAAVVTLALPQLLLELDTTVEGVAAVIGVYTLVLTLALPLSAALHNRATGAAGALLFAAASVGCASANSLELLLVMRALQAVGASALLAAAFDALDGRVELEQQLRQRERYDRRVREREAGREGDQGASHTGLSSSQTVWVPTPAPGCRPHWTPAAPGADSRPWPNGPTTRALTTLLRAPVVGAHSTERRRSSAGSRS